MNKFATMVLCSVVSVASCGKDEPPPYKLPFDKESIWAQEVKTLAFPRCEKLPSSIVRRYDKFDKNTTFASQALTLGRHDITLLHMATGELQRVTNVPEYVLLVTLYNRSLYDFRFMIDGKNIHKIEADEHGVIRLPMRLLVDLANAKRIECRLNSDDYVLTAAQQQIFKDMACVFVP